MHGCRHAAILFLGALVCSWCAASCSVGKGMGVGSSGVPTAVVQQGRLRLEVHTVGELRASKTALLTAPPIGGGNLRIIRLLRTGTSVKPGDVVVAFDPSQQAFNLGQNRSNFEQAREDIVKAKDDAAVQQAQDRTALLKAQFSVRQAELEVSKNELVSAIDAQKNNLALDEAKRALAQLQQDMHSHSISNQAAIAVARQKSDKARLAMQQAQQNIANMQLKAPIDGIVVVRKNNRAAGGLFYPGMSLPEFQVGDQVNPGSPVAEVISTNQMQLACSVHEGDRPNVQVGDRVDVRIDALPRAIVHGKIINVAGMSGGEVFFDASPRHQFGVTIELDKPDPRFRPGFTAHITILGRTLAHAVYLPEEAVFQRNANPTVYVARAGGYRPVNVKLRYFTQGLAVVSGLDPGTKVALLPPQAGLAGRARSSPGGANPIGPGAP